MIEMGAENSPIEGRKYQIVLLGILSMFFAEVCSGSSLLWFFDVWSLLVTFPLYWAHILFFLTLAIKTKRTTLSHLYLWGILFGLYESWITKVTWIGYPSTSPLIPPILGVAVVETIVVVFFWHPIFSFIAPILTFEILAAEFARRVPEVKMEDIIIPSHIPYLTKTRGNLAKFLAVIFIGATGLVFNSGFNQLVALFTLIGTFAGLWVVLKAGLRKTKYFSIFSVKLEKRGFTIVTSYLILLYAVTFPLLRPEGIPASIIPILIILSIYAVAVLLLYLNKPNLTDEKKEKHEISKMFSMKDLRNAVVIFTILTVIENTIPPISAILFTVMYFSFIALGLGLFIYTIVRILISTKK